MTPALALIFGAGVLGAAGSYAVAVEASAPAAGGVAVSPEWIGRGKSDYFEHCAGCHGVEGSSAPAKVPELRDRVGYFMCTQEARDYLVRLPNVAHARIDDPAELADLINYVVFVLGGPSAPTDAKPFTSEEVARLRRQPLANLSLTRERARLVSQVIAKCGAPSSLKNPFVVAPAS